MNRMTCREFDEVVHELVRLELLDVSSREDALDHAARCSQCAGRMDEARTLAEETESAANEARVQSAKAEVETVVLAAFRKDHQRRGWRRAFEWATVGVAAAVILVVLWASSIRPRVPAGTGPKKDVFSQSSAPVEATGPKVSQTGELSAGFVPGNSHANPDATVEASEQGDFVPVPYAEQIGPEDSAMVVRVELTRGSLAGLGYPVDQLHASDWIRADMLVGQDGWPRAVRLVQ